MSGRRTRGGRERKRKEREKEKGEKKERKSGGWSTLSKESLKEVADGTRFES